MGTYLRAAEVEDVAEGKGIAVAVGGREVAVFRLNGKFYAIDNTCPHGKGGHLARGSLADDVVTCSLHGWKFHLSSGRSVNHPGIGVRVYTVRVTDADRIEVQLS